MLTSFRATSSSILIAFLLAGCGGKSKPAGSTVGAGTSTGATSATPGNGAAAKIGTSGAPGLDWGANAAAVTAMQPRATPDKAGLVYLGTVEKRQGIVHYAIGDAGLTQIDVEFTDGFADMAACGEDWKALRAILDERLGASQADNLAAYWSTPTARVTLACNPNDSGAGVLSLVYAQPTSD